METRAADKKTKYDPNTSYERENLERIAKEWAKFCKDKGVLNPGRHDFRIWMEQNYPRITPLDALKQMAMDAVWGKADPYRSPSNGEPEHQADHYQKRMSGDKDKKEKTEAARATAAKNETVDLGMGDKIHVSDRGDRGIQITWECGFGKNKGQLMDIAMGSFSDEEVKKIVSAAKSALYETQHLKGDDKIRDAQKQIRYVKQKFDLGTTAAKIDRVWVITYPGPQSTLNDILFAANVADLQKQFAGGLDPKDVFGMYDNEKEARENAEALLSAQPGKIEAAMRAKAGEDEPEKPWTPHFKLVALDETKYWSDSVFKDFPEIKAIYGIYLFDETLGVHMMELTPSHELWFVNHYITYTDEFEEKFHDSNDEVSDEAKERMIQIEDYIRENADYSERVTYMPASDISGMGSDYIQDIGEGVSTEEDDYESQMEDAIEHENGNPSSWDALDKKPATDPRVRTDKDMQRENRPATEKEQQTTIHNFARRVRATRIKGNWKAKAGGETAPKDLLDFLDDVRHQLTTDARLEEMEEGEQYKNLADRATELVQKYIPDHPQFKYHGGQTIPGTTAMRTRADADDEGGDLRTELTDEDGMAIIDKIQNTPDMPDSDFHEFVEGMGVKPSAAETFAYGLLYDLLNEGATEPAPIDAEARRKAKAADVMVVIPENDIIPEKGEMSTNQVVALLRKYKGDPAKVQFIADMMEK